MKHARSEFVQGATREEIQSQDSPSMTHGQRVTRSPLVGSLVANTWRSSLGLLARVASVVPSESAFSTGHRVVSDCRSRLSNKAVEALICLQDWYRSDVQCDIVEEEHYYQPRNNMRGSMKDSASNQESAAKVQLMFHREAQPS